MSRDELSQQAIRLANELRRVRNEAKRAPAKEFPRYWSRAKAIRKQMKDVLDKHARTPL